MVKRLLAERPVCECCLTRASTEIHEVYTRARSGSDPEWLIDETNLLALCNKDHRFITDNADWAEDNGFIITAGGDTISKLQSAKILREEYYKTVKSGRENP